MRLGKVGVFKLSGENTCKFGQNDQKWHWFKTSFEPFTLLKRRPNEWSVQERMSNVRPCETVPNVPFLLLGCPLSLPFSLFLRQVFSLCLWSPTSQIDWCKFVGEAVRAASWFESKCANETQKCAKNAPIWFRSSLRLSPSSYTFHLGQRRQIRVRRCQFRIASDFLKRNRQIY